ncbi:MAG: LysM peptidoglycan-binding domain-containing protein [Desulfobulbaceae bacterium]|nr:LysM peptidoglycan-binding domain-containing protein [Desulfobulbaceae bacterium]
MDTLSLTSIQELIQAGRIVEARTLLAMHASAFSEEERNLLVQELDRRQAEAATLVAQAEALEIEGQTAEAKALYESVLLLANDFPGIQSHIKRTEESLFLTKAVQRRSQRLRESTRPGRKTPRKNRSMPLIGAGLAASVLAVIFLQFFLKTPQQPTTPDKTRTETPVQLTVSQPASPPPIADSPAPPASTVVVSPAPPVPPLPEKTPEDKPVVAEPLNPPEIILPPTAPAPPAQPEETVPPTTAPPSPATNEQNKEEVYTVQPGDSLSLIALQRLCDQDAWKKIHALNRERVTDPNKLHPGLQLQLKGIKNRCPVPQ